MFLLAIVAIATAWSGFQAAKWDGKQSVDYGTATRLRFEADAASTAAGQEVVADVGLFTAWLAAHEAGDEPLQMLYRKRMTPEYQVAFDAWVLAGSVHQSERAGRTDRDAGVQELPRRTRRSS